MGRKVHPIGFRLGIIKEHKSRWFASGKQYTTQLAEDRKIREMVFADLAKASVSNVDIERQPNQVHVIIDTARPGVIIGKKGESVNKLRTELQALTQKKVKIDVREITKPELDSRLVAVSIAEQLGAPYQLEARHEAVGAEDDACWGQGHHDHRVGSPGRQRHGPCGHAA